MLGIAVGLALLVLLIVAHEVGHLLAARASGVPVDAFAIGFGPAVREWRRGGTIYRLGAIPLGGYVRYRRPSGTRPSLIMGILLAGPAANLVVGALLLVAAAAAAGVPDPVATGFAQTAWVARETLRALGLLAAGDLGQLGGPVLIARVTGAAAEAGLVPVVQLTALLSLNLAVLNLLPIPVLDGGRVLLVATETLRGRPFQARVQRWLALSGVAALLALTLLALANDVARLIA